MRSFTTELGTASTQRAIGRASTGSDPVERREPHRFRDLLPNQLGAGFPQDFCVVHLPERLHEPNSRPQRSPHLWTNAERRRRRRTCRAGNLSVSPFLMDAWARSPDRSPRPDPPDGRPAATGPASVVHKGRGRNLAPTDYPWYTLLWRRCVLPGEDRCQVGVCGVLPEPPRLPLRACEPSTLARRHGSSRLVSRDDGAASRSRSGAPQSSTWAANESDPRFVRESASGSASAGALRRRRGGRG